MITTVMFRDVVSVETSRSRDDHLETY